MTNTDSPAFNIHSKAPRNWSREEDIQLCRSWINISVDPVQGTDQPNEKMWERIQKNFQEERKRSVLFVGGSTDDIRERPFTGLQQRWSTIHPLVSKFCGFYKQIENRDQNDSDPERMLSQTYEVYAASVGKSFKLHHCWSLLRHEEKWKRFLERKPKPVAASTPARRHLIDNSDEEEVYPTESKKARKAVQEKSKTDELFEMLREQKELENGQDHKYMEILQSISLELHAANELKKKDQDIKMLTVDISTLKNKETVAFFLEEQKEIIGRMRKNRSRNQ